ncbi:M20 family metallopeptidase [Halanaerobium praevalens]|uniref:Peptidase M20 n=1 Tax=Halanaerobium praevalens (strain ATCC 33744 / DSM 2228 / GSL) TaxID=572479 RepID=E3DP45_HALPG|nr:M20/M25/M40 family metallo-hydrolase [Halanaerobium praevalens]ADO77678.1 peptidase M20 [Halanaerobium praevalens DSM 2228]
MVQAISKYINRKQVEVLLADLIKIPSPFFREDEIIDYVFNWFENNNLPVSMHQFEEKKVTGFEGRNVVGSLKGDDEGPKILLNGHLDTVEICEGWTKKPLGAEIVGDKMYGVGALDMKSGCAAIMLAVNAFSKTVSSFNGEILYTLVSDEEGPFGLGTDNLILDGYTEDVDVAIVPEPSSGFAGEKFPCLCLGARGGWKYKVNVKGKSAHGANPEKGINAISEAAKILLEIEKSELKDHEKLGPGSICILDVEGGGAPLSVPDKASFSIFRHVTIGEDKNYIRKEFAKALAKADIKGSANLEFREAPHKKCDGFLPYVVSESNPYTQTFKESVLNVTDSKAKIAYFSSVGDFNYLGSRVKVPTFVFGPAGKNYHSADEYVDLNSVVQTAEVIYNYLLKILVD